MVELWRACLIIFQILVVTNYLVIMQDNHDDIDDDLEDDLVNGTNVDEQKSYFQTILQEDFPITDCDKRLETRKEEKKKTEQKEKFSIIFKKILEDIGYNMLQKRLDTEVDYRTTPSDQRHVLDELISLIKDKFRIYEEQLQRARTAILNSISIVDNDYFHHANSEIEPCCELQSERDEDKLCVVVTKDVWATRENKEIFSGADLLQAYKRNARDTSQDMPVFQYFATPDGVSYFYPAMHFDENGCQKSNALYRPWYRNVVSPPVQLVMVIDTATYMTNNYIGDLTLFDSAKYLIKLILDSMTLTDRVLVIGFSEGAVYPSTHFCFTDELTLGTTAYKEELEEFIDNLPAIGRESSFLFGLRNATIVLRNVQFRTGAEKIILYLSGAPSIDSKTELTNYIRGDRLSTTDHVVIFGVSLGDNPSAKEVLQAMVDVDGNQYGQYIEIHSKQDLNNAYKTFFNSMEYNVSHINTSMSISLPYLDGLVGEIVMTITIPVIIHDKLVGVLGMDTSPEMLYDELQNFRRSVDRHFFMIYREDGSTFYHPIMPKRSSEQVIYMHIKLFESHPDVQPIIRGMRNGSMGRMVANHIRQWPRGHPFLQGARDEFYRSEFIWSKIEGTPFSLCLVVDTGNQEFQYRMSTPPSHVPFTFHMDILRDKNKERCRSYTRLAVADEMSIIFTSTAFTNSEDYAKMNDKEQVEKYKKIVSRQLQSDLLTDHAVNSVDIIGEVSEALSTGRLEGSTLVTYLSWRYIALESGVFAINPAVTVPKTYQHITRYWYHAAIGADNGTVISSPYLDIFGSSWIVTIAKVLIMRDVPNNIKYKPFGVLAGDITLLHLSYLIKTYFTDCGESEYRCVIIDTAGYVVLHDDMILPPAVRAKPQIEHIHLIEKEPAVAIDLIDRGFMKQDYCFNLDKLQKHYYYSMQEDIHFSQDDPDNPIYWIDSFAETNIILIQIPSTTTNDNLKRECTCSGENNDKDEPVECVGKSKQTCECPCYTTENSYICPRVMENKNWKLCSPLLVHEKDSSHIAKESKIAQQFDDCYDRLCSEKRHMNECHMMSGCRWCEENTNGVKLTKPFCAKFEVCFYGRLDYPSPYPMVDTMRIGPVVFLIVIFSSVVSITLGYYVFKRKLAMQQTTFEDFNAVPMD